MLNRLVEEKKIEKTVENKEPATNRRSGSCPEGGRVSPKYRFPPKTKFFFPYIMMHFES